ncbi:hypothetical protein [Streptomyces goshikiensis]|uniref:hypothetical protein n=1 Tax=Streptomyces goshikiensis TaxID=1942 RepID=UPI003678349B
MAEVVLRARPHLAGVGLDVGPVRVGDDQVVVGLELAQSGRPLGVGLGGLGDRLRDPVGPLHGLPEVRVGVDVRAAISAFGCLRAVRAGDVDAAIGFAGAEPRMAERIVVPVTALPGLSDLFSFLVSCSGQVGAAGRAVTGARGLGRR